MNSEQTTLIDVRIFSPDIHEDDRGYFFESFQKEKCSLTGYDFVQDNESFSHQGVLRGLHFQKSPHEQGKLVRVLTGEILDVVVDLRVDSDQFGQHIALRISEKNRKQIWIPPGFAHGFLVLSDSATINYKCTSYYQPKAEGCVLWNDPDLDIDWGISDPLLSDKDRQGMSLKEYCQTLT